MRGGGILVVLLLVLGSLGCPGDLPRNDGKPPTPTADSPGWPDQPPAQKDLPSQPPHPDGYVSASFGCQTADDCFGQECCPTAWGVRLCAPTCWQ